MAKHSDLIKARNAKKDEFYTLLEDIEQELSHYKKCFNGKVVYLNCDKVGRSQFWEYFHLHFAELGLKKLVATWYDVDGGQTEKIVYEGGNDNDITIGVRIPLIGNGSFDSEECVEELKNCDIVVTNPPFSLFRQFISLLMEYNKKFIVWANNNAITYREIFSLFQENKIWLGYICNQTCAFRLGKDYNKYDEKLTNKINDGYTYGKVPSISTFTNLDIHKRHENLVMYKTYNAIDYPKYDNYDAINVNKTENIPCDYKGIMGVPITFLGKYNPEQFEIVGLGYGELAKQLGMLPIGKDFLELYFKQGNKGNYVANNVLCCYINSDGYAKIPYARILIRKIN